MALLFWKNNREIDALAKAVADDLLSYIRSDVARQHVFGTGKLPKKKKLEVEQKFTDIIPQMQRFGKAKSLGINGKARLQKKFNERLEELGYESDVVNKIAEIILLRNLYTCTVRSAKKLATRCLIPKQKNCLLKSGRQHNSSGRVVVRMPC